MEVVEGGSEPDAHLHRRMMPECDFCSAALRGPMPKPYWIAPSDREPDEHGHPTQGDAAFRVYLCREHRTLMDAALDRAVKREHHRRLAGQRLFATSARLGAVKNEPDET